MTLVAAAKDVALDAVGALITHLGAHSAVPDAGGSAEITGAGYLPGPVTWRPSAGGQKLNNGDITVQVPAGITAVAFGYRNAAGVHYGHALVGNTRRGMGTVDTAGVTGDLIVSAGHGLAVGARVVVYPVLGEALPAGLTASTVYHVTAATADTFQVSAAADGPAAQVTGEGELYWADCTPCAFRNRRRTGHQGPAARAVRQRDLNRSACRAGDRRGIFILVDQIASNCPSVFRRGPALCSRASSTVGID